MYYKWHWWGYKDDLYISEYYARNYNVAVLNVNYHCIGNRPQTGAKIYLDDIDRLIFDTSVKAIGIEIPYDISKLNSFEEFHPAMDYLNKEIQKNKNDLEIDRSYHLDLSASLQPTKNEYQNFGIMQVTDILNALLYIRKNFTFKAIGGGYKAYFSWSISWRLFGKFMCKISSLACWCCSG